jgi:hypothetical protein
MKLFEIAYSKNTGNFLTETMGRYDLNVFDKTIFLLKKAGIVTYPIMDIKEDVELKLDGKDDPILIPGSADQKGAYIYMSLGVIYKASESISEYEYIKPFWEYFYCLPEGDFALEYQGQIRNYLLIKGIDIRILYPWEYRKYLQAIRNEMFL